MSDNSSIEHAQSCQVLHDSTFIQTGTVFGTRWGIATETISFAGTVSIRLEQVMSRISRCLRLPCASHRIGMIDRLYIVLRLARKFFIHMETSPLPVNGCKNIVHAWCLWPVSRKGSLSCHRHVLWHNPRFCCGLLQRITCILI